MKSLVLASLLALSACGGGGASAPTATYAVKMMVRLGQVGSVPAEPGFNASVITTSAQTISESVAQQASAPDDVALTIGWNAAPSTTAKSADFSTLPKYLSEAAAHQNIKWVYVYDEMFWESGAVAIGANEQAITDAARQVKAAGLKAAVSIPPVVLMAPGFALAHPDAFDVVAIDLYPQYLPSYQLGDCSYDANPYTTLLYCSIKRLRAAGYRGEVWYVFEAFGNSLVPDLNARLALQRQTIAAAPSFGVTGLVSFGFYDDTRTNLLPPTYPGHGSAIDPLVNCRDC